MPQRPRPHSPTGNIRRTNAGLSENICNHIVNICWHDTCVIVTLHSVIEIHKGLSRVFHKFSRSIFPRGGIPFKRSGIVNAIFNNNLIFFRPVYNSSFSPPYRGIYTRYILTLGAIMDLSRVQREKSIIARLEI